MTRLAKLDGYNYKIFRDIIRIKLSRTNDPILVDIMSDIYNSGGNVYVEGNYYSYSGKYEIVTRRGNAFLELHVTELQTA
jgi:hypothetical protein